MQQYGAFLGAGCEALEFCVDKKNQLDVTFVFFISFLLVAQHVSGNQHEAITSRSRQLLMMGTWLPETC